MMGIEAGFPCLRESDSPAWERRDGRMKAGVFSLLCNRFHVRSDALHRSNYVTVFLREWLSRLKADGAN
jgi:hypothetical protein